MEIYQNISRGVPAKDSVSLNGLIVRTFNFNADPSTQRYAPFSNDNNIKSITIDNQDVLSYFSLFVRDYTPQDSQDPATQPDVPYGDSDAVHKIIPAGNTADRRRHKYTIDSLTPKKDITSNYNDITQNIRLVDDNLKICANNSENGTWKKDAGAVWWVSFESPYITIFQNEGYIDFETFEESDCKEGWNKNMGVIDCYHEVVLDGLLIFPYGPAIISMPNNADKDEFGPYYKDIYDDDVTPTGIGKERYYTKYGKILGSMTANTIGMVSVQGSAIIDDDSVDYDAEAQFDYDQEVVPDIIPSDTTQDTSTDYMPDATVQP